MIVLPVLVLAVLGGRGLVEMQRNVLDQARSQAQAQCEKRVKELQMELMRLLAAHPVPGKFDDPPKPVPAERAVSVEMLKDSRGTRYKAAVDLSSRKPWTTESGLPTDVLREFQRWQELGPEGQALNAHFRQRLMEMVLVDRPSVVTPQILGAIDPGNTTGWRDTWQGVLRAQAYLRNRAVPEYRGAQLVFDEGPVPGAEKSGRRGAWLFGNGVGVIENGGPGMLAPDTLNWASERIYTGLMAQRGWQITPNINTGHFLDLENRWVEPTDLPWCQLRVVLGPEARQPAVGSRMVGVEVLASAGDVPVVTALLGKPELLFGEQQGFLWWFGLLLAVSVLSALTGLYMLRRSIMRERALSDMKTNFIASVTHELRAPVASMRLLAEGLEAGHVTGEEKRRDYFRLMVEECRRLGALIANVLDLSRIERGSREFRLEETDLPALVRDTVRLHGPRAESLRLVIDCDVAELDPPAVVDALAVQQALANLLDNALKFAPRGSCVTVRLEQHELQSWRLSVEDHGPGVPAAERSRIFDAFYRVGSELRRETQGVGIGLAIVKHIVDAHRGRVWVESEPNKRTLFIVEAPLAQPPPHGLHSDH